MKPYSALLPADLPAGSTGLFRRLQIAASAASNAFGGCHPAAMAEAQAVCKAVLDRISDGRLEVCDYDEVAYAWFRLTAELPVPTVSGSFAAPHRRWIVAGLAVGLI